MLIHIKSSKSSSSPTLNYKEVPVAIRFVDNSDSLGVLSVPLTRRVPVSVSTLHGPDTGGSDLEGKSTRP